EEMRRRYDETAQSAATLAVALIEKRAPYDELIAEIEARWAGENAELIQNADKAATAAQDAEGALRKAILTAYELDKTNKQIAPHLKLSVRVPTEVIITDEKQMNEWLKANTGFLSPDMPAIKKAAKDDKLRTALKMGSFIEIKEKPIAQI